MRWFHLLYHHSPLRFQDFLNDILQDTQVEVGVDFKQQTHVKGKKKGSSTPDAQLFQRSFRIVIETKLGSNFTVGQLRSHLTAFADESLKVLFLINPELLEVEKISEIQYAITNYNKEYNSKILLKVATFEEIIESYERVLGERDFEIKDILQEYEQYCEEEGLLPRVDHMMRVVSCGISFDENILFNLYYDPAHRAYRNHKYLGLYKSKSIKAIGEIENIIYANKTGNNLNITNYTQPVSESQRNRISEVISSAKTHYDIQKNHKFFLVKQFFPTDFQKTTKGGIMSQKYFDLKKVLDVEELPITETIADILSGLNW